MAKDPIIAPPGKLLEAFDFASTMAEKEKGHEAQTRALLLSFLEVADSFDRCFAAPESRPEHERQSLKTFELIRKQLDVALSRAGVTPIICLGRTADPALHEIVEVRYTGGVEEEVIVEEIRRGYEWNGEVLRPPQVVIARRFEEE